MSDAPALDEASVARALRDLPPADRSRLESALARMRRSDAEQDYLARVIAARTSMSAFMGVTMPDLSDKANPFATRYRPVRHHDALCAALQQVESGVWPNLIVTMPPRHGKSEHASKKFSSWFVGRDSYRQVIFATYNEDLAGDTGREVRETLRSPEFAAVFPACVLAKGSASVDRVKSTFGGGVFFAGRGGAITGRGADLAIVDDPLKGREEAESRAIRNRLWEWYNDDLVTRLLSEGGRQLIIMTRWHEDDLVGRLTDPQNEHYNADEARNWRVLDLPALARDNDPLGRKQGDALWPERFSADYLNAIRLRNPRGFASLYQGRPTPEDGDEFKADWLKTYNSPAELPKNLRKYGASDHAVSTNQVNDRTCLGCAGVDEDGIVWVMPDLDWGRFETDDTVDRMLAQFRRHNPLTWWAEDDHIKKSIGPFLRKRMLEERTYCAIIPSSTSRDVIARAQAVKGLLAMQRIRFPAFAPWWEDAKDELLKFPNASHDDFVSWLSHLGRGVDRMVGAQKPAEGTSGPKRGTLGWLRDLSKRQANAARDAFKGW